MNDSPAPAARKPAPRWGSAVAGKPLNLSGRQLRAVLGVVLLALVAASLTRDIVVGWTQSRGWEFEDVARGWAAGKGISFPGDERWLFDPANPDDRTDPHGYYATAWEEPVPVVVLGTFFWLFGDYGRLAMVITNALCFAATMLVVYHLARRISGPGLGLAAVGFLALVPLTHHRGHLAFGGSVLQLSGAMLAGLAVSVCALLLLRLLERPSIRQALLLGSAIGVSALIQASTIIFVPVAALLALVWIGPLTGRAWQAAGGIVGAALLMLSPWAARNYAAFGELVPVRTGAGYVTYVGNPALAATFDPGVLPNAASLRPPWAARSIVGALRLMDDFEPRHALELYSRDAVRAIAPDTYAKSNEVQRDRLCMREALGFMLRHALVTLQLAAIKAVRFLFLLGYEWPSRVAAGLVAVLPVLGAAVGLKDPRLRALGLMALAYSGVYVITFPFFYRYRYPIEPALAILGGVAIIWLVQSGRQLWVHVSGTPGSDTVQARRVPRK
jgi:4-amino-4-deoxy-L-arabinose transferase-like glycosyltransferase